MKEFIESISKVWWTVFGGIISLTAYFILERFKNRLSQFTSSVTFNAVGTSLQDNVFGNIKVTHNERKINHLNFVVINVINTSNSDFENVKMITWVDNRSQILGWSGNYTSTGVAIYLEKEYEKKYDVFNKTLTEYTTNNPGMDATPDLLNEIMFYQANKVFEFPVFNRKDSITLNLLVENFDGNIPIIKFPILHKSIHVVPEADQAKLNATAGKAMFGIGYLILGIYSFYIFNKEGFSKSDMVSFLIVSILYVWLGYGIYLFYKYMKSLLS